MKINVRIDDQGIPYTVACGNKVAKGKINLTWHLVSAPDHEFVGLVGLPAPPFGFVAAQAKDLSYKVDNKGGNHPKDFGYDIVVRNQTTGLLTTGKAIIRNDPT